MLRRWWSNRPSPAESRSALRLLREWPWARALLGVVVLSVIFVLLGRWQYHRHLTKVAANHRVDVNYAATPAPIRSVLTDPAAPLAKAEEWRPVVERGSYQGDRTVLARNRPLDTDGNDPQYGYEVLVPFRTDGGLVLLVDRGWIPAGTHSAAAPDSVPAPPSGELTVTARLRPGEPHTSRTAPAGQTQRINLPDLSRTLGEPLVGGYGVLAAESPGPADPAAAPTLLPRPDDATIGINLAYAFQWCLFAVAAYVLLGVGAVREVRRRAAAAGPAFVSPGGEPTVSLHGDTLR